MVFPGGSGVKNILANAGDTRDLGLIPGSRTFLGAENGNPLQCSCLENSRDRGTWWAAIHRVADTSECTHTPFYPGWIK